MKNINSTIVISELIRTVLKNKISRNLLQSQLDKYIKKKVLDNDNKFPEFVKLYKYYAFRAMYNSYFKNYDKGIISSKVTDKILSTLIDSALITDELNKSVRQNFKDKYAQNPPNLLTISPTKKCNLNCIGCYAASKNTDKEILTWDLLDKVIGDAYHNMGMRFFVISGGEPLLYKSEGKTILDLVAKWNDCFFLMYTNGTLINESIATRIAELGNITPAISIEGYQENTDKRRGNGCYQKIVKAKDNLINKGVPFGLSVTATRENIDLLMNYDFYDYYFDEFGATYMWVFHYMPIGRDFTSDLMITPEQRINLFHIQNKILIEKKLFVADFWNGAVISHGCISSGRPGGYFYINWDGNIMPCVFVPYYLDNVKTLYESGKTLSDALFSPLFVKGREWQNKYMHSEEKLGNLLMPCFYRDHYKDLVNIVKETQSKPENKAAEEAILSENYYQKMLMFDDQLEKISSPLWNELYDENENIDKKTVNLKLLKN